MQSIHRQYDVWCCASEYSSHTVYMTPQLVALGPSELLPELCRITEETVEELCQENGPYKPIQFQEKYAKRVMMQYMVSISVHCCYHAALMQQ